MKSSSLLKLLFLCILATFASPSPFLRAQAPESEEWITIPAGGKAAFMGINGGTMPISLLVADDGQRLLTFVGRTGNDFMEAVRHANSPLPTFANATAPLDSKLPNMYSPLVAGNATATLPVVTLSPTYLAQKEWLGQLEPFGLSEEPLSIEGQVSRPDILPRIKKYRVFFLSDYFRAGGSR